MNPEIPLTTKQALSKELEALRHDLGWIDFLNRPGRSGAMEYLVIRLERIDLRIDGAANHGRPHFHIGFKRQFSASYSIDNFECLAGSMPAKYSKNILEWARKNQELLYQKWKQIHPGAKVFALELKQESGS